MESKISREEVIKKILTNEEDINKDQEEVLHLILKETVSKDVNKIQKKNLSFGDKVADGMAKFAGSWTFIISFVSILIIWIIGNLYLLTRSFDPYPFILLNLVLSCIAAIQAPIIMMSQNRQEEKDRLRSQNDYIVNVKSELIIEDLHKKIDMLIENQENILKRIDQIENK